MKRKLRVALHILLILIAILLFYYSSGCPPLNTEMAFRQAERAQLLGPSQIVGYEDLSYWFGYDKAIVAQSEYGYSLFEYHVADDDSIFGSGSLTYHPKGEQITLFTSDKMHPHVYMDDLYMPVFLFCENPNAVTAELDLYTHDIFYTGEILECTYSAQAQRSQGSYFLFKVDVSGTVDLSSITFLQYSLNDISGGYYSLSGSATVRLYDADGALLETHVLELTTAPH